MATAALGKSPLTVIERIGAHLSIAPVERVVRRYARPRLLDIGCGHRAHILVSLADRIAHGTGIDESVSAAAKSHGNLTFLEGTAEDHLARLAPETFDVILLVSVLEHLCEPLAALRRCRDLLRTGGTLVVNVPNWAGKEVLELVTFRLKMSPPESIDDHKTYYNKQQLWPLLVQAGFRPSQIRMRYHKLGLNLFATAVKTAS